MSVFSFMRAQIGFLAFGFVCMMFSNLGQTYFIALYADALRDRFALTLGEFGTLYSAVTLASAFCLLWVGRLIDRQPLRVFSALVFVGLAVACVVMATATHLLVCLMALFMLRLFGQGLASHTGMTSISRAYHAHRGVAVSVSQLGYPFGESILPAAVVMLLLVLDWQQSWFVFAALVGTVALPLLIFLARFEPQSDRDALVDEAARGDVGQGLTPPVAQGRGAVLRDKTFYGVVPLYLAPPFLLTGMFLNQLALADVAGWSTTDLAKAFSFYAVIKMTVSLITGRLVDRYSARRLLPFTALPLIAAFAVIAVAWPVSPVWTVYIYLGLIGLNLGMSPPVSGGLWPELYGTQYLGAIRSMTTPFVIFSTALAPIVFGHALDAGVGFPVIARVAMGYLALAACLAFVALHNKRS